MPIPYADLVVSNVTLPAQAFGGQPLTVTWTVTNQGIGTTNIGDWNDIIYLATNRGRQQARSPARLTRFDHFGFLAVGGSYQHTQQIAVPNGLSGSIYVVVTTAGGLSNPHDVNAVTGPFEFIYTTNDTTVSPALPVSQPTTPDLFVTSVQAPTSAQEGLAHRRHLDRRQPGTGRGRRRLGRSRLLCKKPGTPDRAHRRAGPVHHQRPARAGQVLHAHRTRSPCRATSMTCTRSSSRPTTRMPVAPIPRSTRGRRPRRPRPTTPLPPPTRWPSASSRGPTCRSPTSRFRATCRPARRCRSPSTSSTRAPSPPTCPTGSIASTCRWTRPSIPARCSSARSRNQSALGPGEEYQSTAGPVVVPDRFRGHVYVIVAADANHQVDQWPNGNFDLVYKAIHVDPLPLPDLVTSDVIVPTQAIAGATIPVTYTVTNLGAGATLVNNWTDTIWLTQDQGPAQPQPGRHPADAFTHTGSLAVKAGYDQTVNVTFPQHSTRAPTMSRPGPTRTAWSCRTSWRSTSTPTTRTRSTTTTTRTSRSSSWARCRTWSSPPSGPGADRRRRPRSRSPGR